MRRLYGIYLLIYQSFVCYDSDKLHHRNKLTFYTKFLSIN